jgi:threonine aldolase
MDDAAKEKIRSRCTRFLSHHLPGQYQPRAVLEGLAAATPPDLGPDNYGAGEVVTAFEHEVAALLGKHAAVFMPSGTMAQQIALRIWAERKRTPNVAFHPTSHLEIHEEKGYAALHGLHGVLVGSPARLFDRRDVERIAEPLAALLVELPQREIGGQLPSWDELLDVCASARARGAALHLDGARLWECAPFYARPYAEIAGLFDSVYVSFYKGLGGIAGAMLAGTADFVAEARTWQRRHGGNLVSLWPFVLAARAGMTARLGRMAAYRDKAVEIAERLAAVPGVEIVPRVPPTNMMHVYLRGDRARLEDAAMVVAEESSTWLFKGLRESVLPRLSYFELTVGDAAMALDPWEIAGLFGDVLRRASP